jgi:hypothetical protein
MSEKAKKVQNNVSSNTDAYEDDWRHIDTCGTKIYTNNDGRMQIELDKSITSRAFKEVLEFLYTDKVRYVCQYESIVK